MAQRNMLTYFRYRLESSGCYHAIFLPSEPSAAIIRKNMELTLHKLFKKGCLIEKPGGFEAEQFVIKDFYIVWFQFWPAEIKTSLKDQDDDDMDTLLSCMDKGDFFLVEYDIQRKTSSVH